MPAAGQLQQLVFNVEDSLLRNFCFQSFQSSFTDFSSNNFFLFHGEGWVAQWVRDSDSWNNPVRANCHRDRCNCADMNYWQASSFNFFYHRCAATCAGTGRPAVSISFTIVVPQRVQVPQVEVMITQSTPSAFILAAYSSANFLEERTAVPLPTVV